jgi:type III pantothenate kinase
MDFVSKEGGHLGGFIVPGFELMKNSLLTNTKKVEVESSCQAGALGQNTTEAVMLGIMQMLESFVKQKVAEIESKYKQDVTIILTGGQARSLSKNLSSMVILEKDLVIEGLRILEKE